MNRLVVLLWLAQAPGICWGLEVYAAPMIYIDEGGERRGGRDVREDLLEALGEEETGMELRFKRTGVRWGNGPESVAEATEVCRRERAEYLLYGYVTERAYNYQAEIRLYEYEGRRVRQVFYGMDDKGHYGRLVGEMAEKIREYIGETFHIRVVEEEGGKTRIMLPGWAGYWTPVGSEWMGLMVGAISTGFGITVIPVDRVMVRYGYRFYVSAGLEVGYRLGVGHPGRYEAYDHSLNIGMPVIVHMRLQERHHVFGGLGFMYFIDFLDMRAKYEERGTNVYNTVGMEAAIGYRFFVEEGLAIYFRNNITIQFGGKALLTYAPIVGIEFQIYEKEVWGRW